MPSIAATAELALLLEVASAPTPGNVDRERDLPDLRFEQFLAGATGAREGFELAAEGERVGRALERAVVGMADVAGENTQFGSVLLLSPLVRAAADGDLTPGGATAVAKETTVADAVDFYRAFDHAEVRVSDPPDGMDDLDVRRGSEAIPAVEERGLTLFEILAKGSDRDGIAREWIGGFERTFRAAELLANARGSLSDRAAAVHLRLLAAEPDSLVETVHGPVVAEEVSDRAAALVGNGDPEAVREFAVELIDREINPGTTADILAGGLFVALHREVVSI